jgi:FtsZ-binding cell division protein ZapB
MNKNMIKVGSVILLTSILLTGCSNSLKDENNTLKKELTEVKSENASLVSKNKDLTNKLEEKQGNGTDKVPVINSKNSIYTIYTANVDSYEKEVDAYVYIPDSTKLKQKLTIIANVLSEGYYNNLPIEVVKIEEVDNKKIAVINLNESKENQNEKDSEKWKGKTWATQYLQGSAGGAMTTAALIETFLQRNHTGEWIDAVKFLYNNGSCDFQHAPELMEVNYRD